jgi:hypothetical protein
MLSFREVYKGVNYVIYVRNSGCQGADFFQVRVRHQTGFPVIAGQEILPYSDSAVVNAYCTQR